jgi:imidazolonepropionase-like amidohydrolase
MKSLKTPATLLFTASLTLLTFTACSKTERETVADKTKVAYQDTKEVVKDVAKSTKDAVVQGWDNLKSFTFEKRDAFTAEVKLKQAQLDVQVSELKANYAEAKASASRRAAMEDLKSSEADYKDKLAALGHATADTWDAARDNVVVAWDRLQVSYAKARASN